MHLVYDKIDKLMKQQNIKHVDVLVGGRHMPGFTCWQGQKTKENKNDRRPKKLPL